MATFTIEDKPSTFAVKLTTKPVYGKWELREAHDGKPVIFTYQTALFDDGSAVDISDMFQLPSWLQMPKYTGVVKIVET